MNSVINSTKKRDYMSRKGVSFICVKGMVE